ncbi:MAG TPA: ABC transporter substrate-binding protein [Solirubrobacteraceae bacterium]|nr:ABC transporter substrate-binding protein [Solirubrobacteraceae bacterium]
MRNYVRPLAATLLAALAAVAIGACGSGGSSSSSSAATSASSSAAASSSSAPAASGGTVKFVEGVFPQSLDPGLDYTTQGAEVNWLVYTGLVTYAHANGIAGTKLIPGLCSALPAITNGGKTYTCTLRKGLEFSNSKPVVASDFTYAVERSIKIPWGGSGEFITPQIAGAQAYSAGKAKSISGITTNDGTGQIVIHLVHPYGPFVNVLAEPTLGLIPAGFPLKVEPTSPPPGVGPYEVKNIVANQSYDVVRNPLWPKMNVPGIPAGHVDVDVTVNSNVQANALAVLNNSADVFDWADAIPGSVLAQIQAGAKGRFGFVNLGGSTYYIFLNSQEPPFNNQLAREAVVTGLNQDAMARLGGGTLVPACFFLPPAVAGHPQNATCPYGTPGTGDLAKAKALVKQSGLAGTPVTVWSQDRQPRLQWMTYYTQFLNSIGFKATQKVIADATYFTTIGESKSLHPQTGFADWNQDFPNPVDFYGVLLDGQSILPTNNENFGETNDPYINSQVSKLSTIPTTQLQQNSSAWQSLDEYVAKKAYAAVFGYQKFPEFTSDRINYNDLVFHSIYGWDFTSFQLK